MPEGHRSSEYLEGFYDESVDYRVIGWSFLPRDYVVLIYSNEFCPFPKSGISIDLDSTA